jgi:hypothetical protein
MKKKNLISWKQPPRYQGSARGASFSLFLTYILNSKLSADESKSLKVKKKKIVQTTLLGTKKVPGVIIWIHIHYKFWILS